jgi:hypothetical protein
MARHFTPDDRHNITDPYADPQRWAESVKKGRIGELFLTKGGLDGHVQQVQQEIKRMVSDKNVATKMEGKSGGQVGDLITAVESVKSAVVSAAKGATFDFPKFSLDFGTLTGPLYIERTGGKVFRDGKPA